MGLPEVVGQHSGPNIANYLFDVVKEYGIGEKIGYFQLDNATNNDTAVAAMDSVLKNEFGEKVNMIKPAERRLRCFGHILNLAARHLLFGEDAEALDVDDDSGEKAEEEFSNEFSKWRKTGAIGKLRNFEVFVKRSPQRQHTFRSIQMSDAFKFPRSILLSSPNATRWNSVFLMVNDALNLREVIERYLRDMLGKTSPLEKADRDKLKLCQMSNEEWDDVVEIHVLLYPFWEMTMKMQGNVAKSLTETDLEKLTSESVYNQTRKLLHQSVGTSINREDSAIFNVLPAFESLLKRLETAKEREDLSPMLRSCVHLAWKKMDEYYQATDVSKVYLVASVLDPRLKMEYFKKHWKKSWLKDYRKKLDDLMEEFTTTMG